MPFEGDISRLADFGGGYGETVDSGPGGGVSNLEIVPDPCAAAIGLDAYLHIDTSSACDGDTRV